MEIAGGFSLFSNYRLTVNGSQSIHDLSGLELDGDEDGNSGGNLVLETPWNLDFGDAPDTLSGTSNGDYQTLASDGGPSHMVVAGLFMGASVDDETTAVASPLADGDDSNGTDDEDAFAGQIGDLLEGTSPEFDIVVTNTTGNSAMLYGWIDYNGDGVFDTATEGASVAVPDGLTGSTVTLTFPTIPTGSTSETFARFRLSTDTAAENPIGHARDGEVEDHRLNIVSSPKVTEVLIGGSDWTTLFLQHIDPGRGLGHSIPVGSGDQLRPMPWGNIDQVHIVFDRDVAIAANQLEILGVNVSSYPFTLSYDSTTFTATMTLSTPFAADKLLVKLDDSISDATLGNLLDGEWDNPNDTSDPASSAFPSGDGTTGGDFEFRIDVLPGDVNQSGAVSSNDGFAALKRQFLDVASSDYLMTADIDGSGKIQSNDGFFSLQRQFIGLPAGTPNNPAVPAVALVAQALDSLHRDRNEVVNEDDDFESLIEDIVDDLVVNRKHGR